MSKKQVFLISLVAALPAAFLLFVLIMAAVNHGSGVFAGLKWLFWGVALVGGAIACVTPVLIGLLYPAQGFAQALATAGAPLRPISVEDAEVGGDDEFDDLDGDEVADDGEQLFDDNAIGDEFDDELDVGFGDDEDDEKY